MQTEGVWNYERRGGLGDAVKAWTRRLKAGEAGEGRVRRAEGGLGGTEKRGA